MLGKFNVKPAVNYLSSLKFDEYLLIIQTKSLKERILLKKIIREGYILTIPEVEKFYSNNLMETPKMSFCVSWYYRNLLYRNGINPCFTVVTVEQKKRITNDKEIVQVLNMTEHQKFNSVFYYKDDVLKFTHGFFHNENWWKER